MEKKFIAMLVCVALMGCIFVSAQDICKTVANVPMVQFNNGVLMPQFGLGTFMQSSGSICEQSCLTALKIGYWHIDTAHAQWWSRSGTSCKGEWYFTWENLITSKLWPTEYGESKTLEAIDKILEHMQLICSPASRRFCGCMAWYGKSTCIGNQ